MRARNPFALARVARISVRAQLAKRWLNAQHNSAPGDYLKGGKDIPTTKIAHLGLDGIAAMRDRLRSIISKERELTRLPERKQTALVDVLCQAAFHAQEGLRLTGKRSRGAAWTQDILVRDVCDALRSVGVPVPMRPRRDLSIAQRLADNIAGALGLPDQGELYHQMQRAKEIKKQELAVSGKPIKLFDEWLVSDLIGRRAQRLW